MSDAAKSFDSNSSSTTLKETRIDNRIECSSSLTSKKFHKMALQRQDSIDQNISNNNQDVSFFHPLSEFSQFFFSENIYTNFNFLNIYFLFFHSPIITVHCSFISRTTF